MAEQRVLMLYESVGISCRQPQDIFFLVTRYYFVLVLRIKCLDNIDGHSEYFVYLLEMQHFVHLESVNLCRHFYRVGTDAVLLVVVKSVESAYKSRYITPCLSWKIWPDFPEILMPSAAPDSLVDISRTAVV